MINIENPIVQRLITLADIHMTFNEKPHGDLYYYSGYDEFMEAAIADGYVFLGEGFFSQAWTHPAINDYAVKLGFKKEDSGAAYAAFCRDNQGLVGIPNIYGIERFDSCYCVILDRLESIPSSFERPDYEDVMYLIGAVINNGHCISYESADVSRFTLSKDKLSDTCLRIHNFFKGIARFDIHRGNVMLDKEGHVVITDPVSYAQQEQPERRVVNHAKARVAHHFNGVGAASLLRKHGEVARMANMVHALDAGADNHIRQIKARKLGHLGILLLEDDVRSPVKELSSKLLKQINRTPVIKPMTNVPQAFNCKKPAFLIARDEKLGIKRNR